MDFTLGGVDIAAGFPLDVTLLVVGLLAGYYGLIRRYGRALHPHPDDPPVSRKQVVSFTAGVMLFWVADGWPMVALSEYLFSAHMLQHLLQGFVIPPLLLLGIPRWMGEVLLRRPGVRRVVQRLSGPVFAGLVFNLVLLATHSPQAIALQMNNDVFHAFDHLLLIGSGLFMYMNLYSPVPHIVPRLQPLVQMFYLFLMSLLPTIPSAFLVFGETNMYHAYDAVPRLWGLPVHEDMQIAGLIMKLGGGFYLWTIIGVKYFRWAAAQERADRTGDPTDTPAAVA
jgi:putative membrane protein